MGNNMEASSCESLDEEGIDYPLFKELHVVITGCHGSGKNYIGNVLLRKKSFTLFTSSKRHYIKTTHTAFGTTVTLARVPSWSGELSSDRKHRDLRQEIKDAVSSFENGPHAIILAIKAKAVLPKTTTDTLEKLLTDKIWDHTIVIITNCPKSVNTEELFNRMKIQSLINTCTKRYCVLSPPATFEGSKKLIDDIAVMVAEKNDSLHFSIDETEQYDESHEMNGLLRRLKQRVHNLKTCRRSSRIRKEESMKDIKRLEKIIEKIQRGSEQSTSSQAPQPQCEPSNREKKENPTETTAELQPAEASRLLGCHEMSADEHSSNDFFELSRNFKKSSSDENKPQASESHKDKIFFQSDDELQSDPLCDWIMNLNHTVDELTTDQFKKMKDLLQCRDEWRIPAGLLDGQDRASVATLLVQTWGERKCIINTRNILKAIPRNDKVIQDLLLPFLEHIGETW